MTKHRVKRFGGWLGVCVAVAVLALPLGSSPVVAQAPAQPQGEDPEVSRLREALRNALGQARGAEDERAKLQARIVKAEADSARFGKENKELNDRLKELKKQRDEDRKEYDKRIADRDETLQKWKDAYAEAATVARSKETDRAKLEADVASITPQLETCRTRNKELFRISRDILARFQQVDLLEVLEREEPALGLRQVDVENEVQDYRTKILDRRETPAPKKK